MDGVRCVTAKKYRSLFNENFNLSFHVPKKDQRVRCTVRSTKKKHGTLTEAKEESFQHQIKRRGRARDEKEKDKQEAQKDDSRHVITVDMQAVMQAPCGLVSQLYYKRKLSVYNFTTYSLSDGKGTCYTWDETEGKRGACETATCLFMYISSLSASVHDVTIYSDCCAGQNRNQYLATSFMPAVNTIPHIKSITHKYLVTGHTQMECDSMHSAIATAKKNTAIYTPSGWDIVLRMARRNNPYLVIPLKHKDILDFKQVASICVQNTKKDSKGQRVRWLDIQCIKFIKEEEGIMFFKYNFDEEEFKVLRLLGRSAKGKRHDTLKTIPRLYTSKLRITEAKKCDLLPLCASEIIPVEHHPFYKALTVSTMAKDRLPEPDVNETDDDTNWMSRFDSAFVKTLWLQPRQIILSPFLTVHKFTVNMTVKICSLWNKLISIQYLHMKNSNCDTCEHREVVKTDFWCIQWIN